MGKVVSPVKRLAYIKQLLILLLFTIVAIQHVAAQQTTTYWTGAFSVEWRDSRNWEGGIPTINSHVVIGERVAANQPRILVENQGNGNEIECYSLTIGGTYPATLTVTSEKWLHIDADLNIKANGNLTNRRTKLTIKGNWRNDGIYKEEAVFQNNNWLYIPSVEFIGTNQTIAGTSEIKFGRLYIKSYVTLQSDLRIQLEEFNFGELAVYSGATIDPATRKINWGGATGITNAYFALLNGATAKVRATNYIDNYSIRPTPAYGSTTVEHTSTIDYAGTIDQNIDNLITYQNLVISGTGVKSLVDNTTVSGGATNTGVQVTAATLDLKTHTLTRAAGAGGSFTVAANATLRVGGPTNTPIDFATRTFNSASTVEYYGANQTVQHNTYGHLTLSNTGVKTMPPQAMTIAGNFTSSGTVQYAAANPLTIGGNVTVGAGSSFGGATFAHTIAGNWTNNGTFTAGTSTVSFTGSSNATITGLTTFSGLTINKATATNYVTLNNNVTATTLNLTSGDLHTGANKVTIVGTRTGNGWVVGTLTRQHAFASGTGYAFNGPYATLTFTGASGIGEITMVTGAAGFEPSGFASGRWIKRLYQVQVASGTFTNASLQLQYKDEELNSCEEDGLKLYFSPTGTGSWSNASRHNYSATDNWVLRNNLTTINGFWTLTDNPSTYKWDGGANTTAWANGANWEVWTDGAPTRGVTGPISSDFVELGSLVPATQPTISATEWVRDIQFFGANQMTLTIASGSLRTNGNLATTGAGAGVQHQLNAGTQQLTIGGNLILNDGSTGNSLGLSSGAGTITVAGNIEQRSTGAIVLGTGTLNIGGNYTYTAGTFAAGTSTVNYNGTGAQAVGAVPYHHLTINKTGGTANYSAATAPGISGNLSVTGAGSLSLQVPTLQVAGGVTISAGTLQGNTSTIDLKGNWSTAAETSFVPGNSTVIFSGSANQTVSATNFNNLSKTTANTLTTTGNSTLTGNLTIAAGTLILNVHTMNRNSTGGQLSLADNATLQVNGNVAFPANYATNALATTSTVIYNGGSTAGIAGVTYGNVTLQGNSTRALLADARVANQMLIASGSTLNDATATLTLDRNLTSNGTISAPNTSLVFTNPAAILSGTGTGATTINHLTIATGGSLNAQKDLTLHGSFINNGNGFSATANRVTFTGAAVATVTSAAPIVINEMRITKTLPATTVTLSADISGLQAILVAAGTLDATNRTLTKKAAAATTLTINDNATMRVGGSNSFPVFDSYSLAAASFAVYNGNNQSVKSIQYGHLHLINTGVATFEAGTALVAGNLIKGNEATVITPATINYNGTAAQLVAALNYNSLTLSSTGAKTFASGETRIADAFTRPGTGAVDARTNASTINYSRAGNQTVLALNYHNLMLSGSGVKSFSGINAVNGAFSLTGTATADLTTTENTIVFDGATQTVPALNYRNISVTAAGIKSLAGDITVERNLTLTAGELATGAHKVMLNGATGALSETGTTAGYLRGTIETQKNLAVNTTETFNGLGITIAPAGGTPGLTKVTRVTGTTVGTAGTSVLRHYKVEPQGTNQNLNATITQHYYNHELNNLGELDLAVYTSATLGNEDNWKLQAASQAPNTTLKSVTVAGIQQMARFTLGGRNTPLPVELVYFRARKHEHEAILGWQTASEQNNAGFEVQASADGKTYQQIGFVESKAGTSSVKQQYSFTDARNGKSGVIYYRIKQTDFDGTFKLYAPQAVNFGQVSSTAYVAYPNPFTKNVKLAIQAEQAGKATIVLHAANGRAILKQEQELAKGTSVVALLLNDDLPRGLYLLTIALNNQKHTLKLIKE